MCLHVCVNLCSNLEYLDGQCISQQYIRIFLFSRFFTFIFRLGHQSTVLEKLAACTLTHSGEILPIVRHHGRSRTCVTDQNRQSLKSQSLKSGSKICSARIKYASRFWQKLSNPKLHLEFGQIKRLLTEFLHQEALSGTWSRCRKSQSMVTASLLQGLLEQAGCLCVSLPVRNLIAWVYIYSDLVLHTLGYREKQHKYHRV